jgi:hypothetical protein
MTNNSIQNRSWALSGLGIWHKRKDREEWKENLDRWKKK